MIPKVQTTKVKIDIWDYIKLKNFCMAKRVKMLPMEGEKIFANHVSDKGQISKIYGIPAQ